MPIIAMEQVLVEYVCNGQTYSVEYEIEYITNQNEDTSSDSSSNEEGTSEGSTSDSNGSDDQEKPKNIVLPIALGSSIGACLIFVIVILIRKKIFKI